MGWKDAPEVGGGWRSAPLVDATDPKAELAEGTGSGRAALIGAGRMSDRLLEGLKQSGLGIGAIFSEALPERFKRIAQEEITKRLQAQGQRMDSDTAAYKPLEEAHPVATALGEAAPLVAAPMLRLAQGAGAGAAMGNMAASAAAPAAMEYGTAGERAKHAALAGVGVAAGGLLGKGVERVAGKVMKPVEKVQSESLDEAIEAARRIGVQLTPGQMTGNKALQLVEARLAKTPGSSGAMQQFGQANDRAINRAAARAMGETADEISPEVFSRASQRIGGEFDRLTSGKTVVLGQDFAESLQLLKAQQAHLGQFADPQVNTLIERGLDLAARGDVDGKVYQSVRSSLGKKANDAFKSGNSELGQALKTMRGAMDDAATSGMTGAEKQAWEAARKQWAALRTLEKGNVVEAGKVAPGRLKEALRVARPKDYKEGRLDGDLADIAKFAEQFKPLPDSGTSQNLLVQGILTGINPAAGAAAVGVPFAAQKAMFSGAGKNYLSNGRELSALERALMDRAARFGTLGAVEGFSE